MAPSSSESPKARLLTLEELKRQHVQLVLDHVDGNKTEAAKILGISTRTLMRYGFKRRRRA